MRRGFSIKKVVKQLSTALITLYVGGTILIELGNVMNGTASPFYRGLTLIGWTVDQTTSTITSTTGTGGILVVVGIVAIASVILQFVDVSF